MSYLSWFCSHSSEIFPNHQEWFRKYLKNTSGYEHYATNFYFRILLTIFNIISQVRGISSSAVVQKLVKPPIQVFGIEGRYACALYSAASKQKSLEAVEKDLTSLQADMKKDFNLRDLLINPTVKRSLKAVALKEAAAMVKFNPATGFFLEQLAENGRLNKIDAIINAFKLIMSAHRGEVVCVVTTARPLDNSQRKELESQLKASSIQLQVPLNHLQLFISFRNS